MILFKYLIINDISILITSVYCFQLDYQKKSIWETLHIEDSKEDRPTASHVTGVIIEKGNVASGITFDKAAKDAKKMNKGDKYFEKYNGDGSLVHEQRHHTSTQDVDKVTGGHAVLVTEDTGSGSKVHTIQSQSVTGTNEGPVITRTYTKNVTTIYGPDGQVLSRNTSYGSTGNQSKFQDQNYNFARKNWENRGSSAQNSNFSSFNEYDANEHGATTNDGVKYNNNYGSTYASEEYLGENVYTNQGGQGENTGRHYTTSDTDENAQRGGHRTGGVRTHHITWNVQNPQHNQNSGNQRFNQYENSSRVNWHVHRGENSDGATSNRHQTTFSNADMDAETSGGKHSTHQSGGGSDYVENTGYQSHRNDYSGSNVREGAGGHHMTQEGTVNERRIHQGRNPSSYGKYNASWDADYAQQGFGAAALGHGFKTHTLDLGVLGSNANVDEHLSERAETRFNADISGHQDQDLGQVVHTSSGSRSELGRSGGGTPWETHSESHWSSEDPAHNRHVNRDNVPTDKPNYNNRFIGRRKRDVDISEYMQCNSSLCRTIKCTVGPMKRAQDAIIVLRYRINIHTLQNVSTTV